MTATIEATEKKPPILPPPTCLITIRREGYERIRNQAISTRTRHIITQIDEGETLQIGSVVYLCFSEAKR